MYTFRGVKNIYLRGFRRTFYFMLYSNVIGNAYYDEIKIDRIIGVPIIKATCYAIAWPISVSQIVIEMCKCKSVHTWFPHTYMIDRNHKPIPMKPMNTRKKVLCKHFVPNSTDIFLIPQNMDWKTNINNK